MFVAEKQAGSLGQMEWHGEKDLLRLGSSSICGDGAGIRKQRLGLDGSNTVFMSGFHGIVFQKRRTAWPSPATPAVAG